MNRQKVTSALGLEEGVQVNFDNGTHVVLAYPEAHELGRQLYWLVSERDRKLRRLGRGK